MSPRRAMRLAQLPRLKWDAFLGCWVITNTEMWTLPSEKVMPTIRFKSELNRLNGCRFGVL